MAVDVLVCLNMSLGRGSLQSSRGDERTWGSVTAELRMLSERNLTV